MCGSPHEPRQTRCASSAGSRRQAACAQPGTARSSPPRPPAGWRCDLRSPAPRAPLRHTRREPPAQRRGRARPSTGERAASSVRAPRSGAGGTGSHVRKRSGSCTRRRGASDAGERHSPSVCRRTRLPMLPCVCDAARWSDRAPQQSWHTRPCSRGRAGSALSVSCTTNGGVMLPSEASSPRAAAAPAAPARSSVRLSAKSATGRRPRRTCTEQRDGACDGLERLRRGDGYDTHGRALDDSWCAAPVLPWPRRRARGHPSPAAPCRSTACRACVGRGLPRMTRGRAGDGRVQPEGYGARAGRPRRCA